MPNHYNPQRTPLAISYGLLENGALLPPFLNPCIQPDYPQYIQLHNGMEVIEF